MAEFPQTAKHEQIDKLLKKVEGRLVNPSLYNQTKRNNNRRRLQDYLGVREDPSEKEFIEQRKVKASELLEGIEALRTDALSAIGEGGETNIDLSNSNGNEYGEKLALLQDKNPCIQLYDPCTKEPIESMIALERRIREIKKKADTIPVGLYGLTNDTSNYDFIMNVFVNPSISLDDMVSFRLGEGGQPGSDIFEVLSRLFVFLGGIKDVNPRDGGNYKFMNKIENTDIYDSSTEALKHMKCKATRAMGISDITLVNHRNDIKPVKPTDPYCEIECDTTVSDNIKTYLMSVKWYKDEKNAEHYDLEKLYTASQKITTAEQRPVGIIVFLKSKADFQIAHNRSYRQYVQELGDSFLGWNEDVKPFLEEKRRILFELANIKGITPKLAFEQQYFVPGTKPTLSLQLHQDIIVKGVCDALGKSTDNLFLVGVLPRGGKTFIAGGIIREFLTRTKVANLSIFWLTAAPNETMTQVKEELIDRFEDFNTFEFIHAREVTDILPTKPHTIIFCSSQLLIQVQKQKGEKGGKQRQFLKDHLTGTNKLGLVFFDEAHKTGTGDETKAQITSIIDTYSIYQLPFIFLTATYYNIKYDYKVLKENTFLWDYTDVLATRALATESEQSSALSNLQNRFGKDLVDSVVKRRLENGDTLLTMAKAYIGFPDLYFISVDFNEEAKKRFSDTDVYRPDSGFSLNSIFAIKPATTILDIKTTDNKVRKDAYKIFENLDNPRNMVAIITHTGSFAGEGESGKQLVKPEGSLIEPSILGRINKASRDSQSRFRLDEKPTLLMFLPVGGVGTNIYYLLCAWASLLMSHSYWRDNYEIACVVEEESIPDEDIKEALLEMASTASTGIKIINRNPKASILEYERTLHCEKGKGKGLVILAGEKLSMGISLPCTDVVFLLNEKKSPDDIIQKMYRALTPSKDKKSSYVVDLNPVRTLAAVYGYTRVSHEGSNTKSEILDIIYDTYTWDGDVFDYSLTKGSNTKPLLFQDRLRELFEKAEQDDTYKLNEDFGGFEKKLADNIRRGIDQEFVSKLRGKFSAEKLKELVQRIGLSEGSKFSIDKSGKLVIRTKVPKLQEKGEEPTLEEAEYVIENFIESLIRFVKYISITSNKPTLEEAIAEYESGTANTLGRSLQMNALNFVNVDTTIQGLEKNPEYLSQILLSAIKIFSEQSSSMVYKHIKGKVDERSERLDTVMKIINKHLTPKNKQKKMYGEVFTPVELIEMMFDYLPKTVWSNPELKWLDPANGIGNFPIVVFYRLDEGLKSWEPNDTKRRKHIIKNMIFMLEIQSNNTRIARNLFNKLCDDCSPNILTIDSLQMTSDKLLAKGFPDKYDIIIGNPPFQKGRNMQFYVNFIDLANRLIKANGYLLYVIPNKILIPNKANVSIQNFNPLVIYHTVNKKYFPSIGTSICAVICKKQTYKQETKVIFENGEKVVDLNLPTPTQYNDVDLKETSDTIFFGKHREHLVTTTVKPSKEYIFISRVWTRYSPDKPGGGGSHVFQIIDAPSSGADGRYVEIPETIDKDKLVWFLTRSESMRFISKIYAGAMNVPAFIWELIPFIKLKNNSDEEAYKLLDLNKKDIDIIKRTLNDNKEILDEEEESVQEGGSRFRATRKAKRT